jgi:hypothetical protein
MILLSVPWSVAMTRYVMFFMNFNTPGGVAAGVFSSLFVIIVPFSYPPINGRLILFGKKLFGWSLNCCFFFSLLRFCSDG